MTGWLERAERAVADTPFETPARWLWSELRSIGRPRVRQSLHYDRQTVKVLSRVLRPDSNAVDVGAHRGSLLLDLRRLAPRGKHIAFEPIPALAARLRERFPQVRVHEMALSDSRGQRTLHYVETSPGLSGFMRMGHVPANAKVVELQVETDTLDHLVPDDLAIRFIKIDVEGAQLEVLRGASGTIRRCRPFIVFEHGMLAEESYGTTTDMVYDLLVTDCQLSISILSDWLEGKPALTRTEFRRHVGHHATSHFCFLAHP